MEEFNNEAQKEGYQAEKNKMVLSIQQEIEGLESSLANAKQRLAAAKSSGTGIGQKVKGAYPDNQIR